MRKLKAGWGTGLCALSLLLVLGLNSCGGSSSSTAASSATAGREGASQALEAFFLARAAANWSDECKYAGKAALAGVEELAENNPEYEGKPCPALLAALAELQSNQALENNMAGPVKSLQVHGKNAAAIYPGKDGKRYAIPMVNEDGEWKVASLISSPAPK